MEFERDKNKARLNFKKDKIGFEESKTVFNDPLMVTFPDHEHSNDESRFISIGLSSNRRVLVVIHTEP